MSYLPPASLGLGIVGVWTSTDISALGTTDVELFNTFTGEVNVALSNPMPQAGRLRGLSVRLSGDVGAAGNDLVVTVYKNGVATALTATVTGGAGTENEAVATVTPIVYAAGDDITVFAKEVGTAAAVRCVAIVWGTGVAGGATVAGGGGGSERDTYANLIASTPAAGTVGFPTDGFDLLQYDSGWSPWGPLLPLTTVPTAGWSSVNSPTVTTPGGKVFVTGAAAASDNIRMYLRSVPSAPYVVTMAYLPRMVWPANFLHCGICLRESGTGEIMTFGPLNDSTVVAAVDHFAAIKWTNATTFSAKYTLTPANATAPQWQRGPVMWLQIEDDNTTRFLRVSNDGFHWFTLFSVGRTDFLTPDQIGIAINSNNATHAAGIMLMSWEEA